MSIDSIHIILILISEILGRNACATGRRTVERVAGGPEWAQLKQDLEDDRFIMGRFKEYRNTIRLSIFHVFLKRIRKT